MRYEIIEGARAFMALEPAYRASYASSLASDPFNSPDWIYTWHAHYGDQGTSYTILIYDDQGQQLLCAFALFRIARAIVFARAADCAHGVITVFRVCREFMVKQSSVACWGRGYA